MYGSAVGVGSYCRTLSSQGVFTTSSNPTLSAVESWLTQISAMLDSVLRVEGFVTPLTQETAVSMSTVIVEMIVADMAKGANSTGRFFSEKSLDSSQTMWRTIVDDLTAWVAAMASGLEELGAERGDTNKNTIGYKDGDNAFPIFQREGFGNTFTDWGA